MSLWEKEEQSLLYRLRNAVIYFDGDEMLSTAKECITSGFDVNKAIFEGLLPGIQEVGRLYEEQVYFIPEMLLCSEVLYLGLDLFRPYAQKRDIGIRGKVLIGVVCGDIHDIGKNIVKMMLETSGFDVYDLGRDVPVEKFLIQSRIIEPDIVCLSTMMTTTLLNMKETIKYLKDTKPDIKIMVGGCTVTVNISRRLGATGYAPNAYQALKTVINILSAGKLPANGVLARGPGRVDCV
ncbi:MAG TPA: cobalamin-dependent protein [Spirochaetia bacterium]|nr:cobalamin-dependent protein [Spirochaetia bacterium]